MANHTPGPWAIEGNCDEISIVNREVDDDTWDIAITTDTHNSLNNACLISAAPDLLLALKDTMLTLAEVAKATNTYQGLIDSPGWIRAMAAVDKAEGKP